MFFCPEKSSTAGQVADSFTCANYDDAVALESFAQSVDCITFEFENIPSDTLNRLSALKPIHPNARVLHIASTASEKRFSKSGRFSLCSFRICDEFRKSSQGRRDDWLPIRH